MNPITVSLGCMSRAMAELAISVALIFGVAGMAHCNSGCAAAMSQDDLYRAETASCAATSPSLAASRQCRADVNKKYNICQTPTGYENCK